MNLPGISTVRLAIGVIGLAAVLSTAWLAKDRFRQKVLAEAAEACATAAESGHSLDDCLRPVQVRLAAEREFQACEAALLPQLTADTRFAAMNSCGPGTKGQIARLDIAVDQNARLHAELASARQGSAAAVARAEARGRASTSRSDHAEQLVEAAGHGAGGRVACDADCLRRLAR